MIGFMLISLAASVAQDAASAPVPLMSSELQAKFDDFLRDPGTAQIRINSDKPATAGGLSERVVCGRYNAKNSYGGYVGFKDFVYLSSNRTLYSDGTAVRPEGTDSVEEIMAHEPKTTAELDTLVAKGKAIIAEVRGAFSQCAS